MPTPITPIKLPLYIKREVQRRTKNLSKWVIEAIQEKIRRGPH